MGDTDLRVRLISNGNDLVVRPRLYEPNPDKMRIGLDRLLGPIGVNRINARVESIDVDARRVTAIVEKGGPEAKAMKQAINTQWIYPPADSAEQLLAEAGQFSNGA
ncbi:hypothetical protein [Mycolicibacterium goodii]|uniref:hypothetical protein n=1 Tax=Mycolicibacterium goodii TaxID=134601 RepID=UPI00194F9E4D